MKNRIVTIKTRIDFETSEEAEFIYESLTPEVDDHHFERSRLLMELEGSSLLLHVSSQDITAAKANISSMLRWITLVTELIEIIPKKVVNTKFDST